MRILQELDCDREIGVVLQAMPDCVVITGKDWLVFPVVVLLESLLLLSLHQFIMI